MAGLDELGYMHTPVIHGKKLHLELFQIHTWSIDYTACLGGLLRAVQRIRGCSRICKDFPSSTHVSSYYGYSLLVALNKQHPHILPYVKVQKIPVKHAHAEMANVPAIADWSGKLVLEVIAVNNGTKRYKDVLKTSIFLVIVQMKRIGFCL